LRAPIAAPAAPETRAELARIRALVAEASALRASGKFAEGLARARDALNRARALGHPPAIAQAGLAAGVLESDAGDDRAGVEPLAAAARAAAEGHDDRVSAEASIELARIYGDKLQQFDKALAFVEPAGWWLARFGSEPALEARYLDVQAYILEGQGKHAEATPFFEKSLTVQQAATGPTSRATARALIALGENRRHLLKFDEAMGYYQRALDLDEKALGPDHPDVGVALNDLASALFEAGRYADS